MLNNQPLRYGTLFSGIDGFGQGFDRNGLRPVFQCEIDKTCREVLARHYPDVLRHDDVTTFDTDKYECPDVLAFGSPCQDLSVAGKRGGLAGERSGLFYEGIRVADAFRRRGLRYVVWENVPGALSSHDGRDIHAVLSAFLELGAVDVAFRCVDSQYYGLAQRRLRLFVVADLRGECAGEILSLPEGLSGHPAPRRSQGERTAACLTRGAESSGRGGYAGRRREDDVNLVADTLRSGGAGNRGWLDPADNPGSLVPETSPPLRAEGPGSARVGDSRGQDCVIAEVSGCLDARAGRGFNGQDAHQDRLVVTHTLRGDGFDASEDGTGRGTPIIPIQGPAAQRAVALGFDGTKSAKAGMRVAETVPPLESDYPPVGFESGMRVRRLTPRECERLQGFEDDYTRYRVDGSEIADGPRYRMLGNAVSVNVAEWIGRGLELAEREQRGVA